MPCSKAPHSVLCAAHSLVYVALCSPRHSTQTVASTTPAPTVQYMCTGPTALLPERPVPTMPCTLLRSPTTCSSVPTWRPGALASKRTEVAAQANARVHTRGLWPPCMKHNRQESSSAFLGWAGTRGAHVQPQPSYRKPANGPAYRLASVSLTGEIFAHSDRVALHQQFSTSGHVARHSKHVQP